MLQPSLVVSPQWLYTHLDDPDIVIVDCRFALMEPGLGRQQYLTSHIPKAHYLDLNQDLSSPVQQHGGRHPLPDLEKLSAKLASIGIASEPPSLVVIYDDSRFAFAARLWWLLGYLGHSRVAILDGGWSAWQQLGYPVTVDFPKTQPRNFIANVQSDRAVDIDTVKVQKDLPHTLLIDAREAERYRGEREPIDPIAGHIPGAVNYPWQDAFDSQGYWLKDQSSRWQQLDSSAEIIVYCGSGVTACVNLLSLEAAGIANAKLYAGSWSDWCSYLV